MSICCDVLGDRRFLCLGNVKDGTKPLGSAIAQVQIFPFALTEEHVTDLHSQSQELLESTWQLAPTGAPPLVVACVLVCFLVTCAALVLLLLPDPEQNVLFQVNVDPESDTPFTPAGPRGQAMQVRGRPQVVPGPNPAVLDGIRFTGSADAFDFPNDGRLLLQPDATTVDMYVKLPLPPTSWYVAVIPVTTPVALTWPACFIVITTSTVAMAARLFMLLWTLLAIVWEST